jgi:hypothetical protein
MVNLVQSMYNLIKTNEGKFKTEKQANFLKSVLDSQDGFLGWTEAGSQIHSEYDELGFIKVSKLLKNGEEIIFERSVEGKLTSLEVKSLASYKRELKKTRLQYTNRIQSWEDGTYGKGDYKSDQFTKELYIKSNERIENRIHQLEENINKLERKIISPIQTLF